MNGSPELLFAGLGVLVLAITLVLWWLTAAASARFEKEVRVASENMRWVREQLQIDEKDVARLRRGTARYTYPLPARTALSARAALKTTH